MYVVLNLLNVSMNYCIHYILLFIILFYSVVFADERDVNNPEIKPLNGLRTIFKQNLNLTVEGDDVEMSIDTINNLIQADVGELANRIPSQDTEFVLKNSESDNIGFKHIRLEQQYKGLRVVGAECIVHINNRNVIYRVNGKYLPDFNISVNPDIDKDDALQIGIEEHKGKIDLEVRSTPSLLIYNRHLAYHYVISYESKEPGHWWYYIDAHTGKIIDSYNNIQYPSP